MIKLFHMGAVKEFHDFKKIDDALKYCLSLPLETTVALSFLAKGGYREFILKNREIKKVFR